MSFKREITDFDYGQTAIENIFINDFMPMGSGTYVKVYLLGYKLANDVESVESASNSMIARHLGIPLEDVLNAWEFWEKKGIIKRHIEDDEVNYDIEFLSLRQLYINNNFKLITSTVTEESIQAKNKSDNLIEASKNPEIKNMFYQIDQIMRRQLSVPERMDILDMFFKYNIEPDIIVRAFEYSVDEKNVKRINYALKVLTNWYDQGLLTIDDIDENLKTYSSMFYSYKQIYKSLGYGSKQVTSGDKEIIDIWMVKEKLNLEFILEVIKESSKKTSNVNMNYIDSIMKRLVRDGVTTIEGYRAQLESQPRKENNKDNSSVKPLVKSSNKFHNFQKSSKKYTNDELEKMLGIKK